MQTTVGAESWRGRGTRTWPAWGRAGWGRSLAPLTPPQAPHCSAPRWPIPLSCCPQPLWFEAVSPGPASLCLCQRLCKPSARGTVTLGEVPKLSIMMASVSQMLTERQVLSQHVTYIY